jgi:RNA polymerase sigma factor (TIGR02999 family)
MAEQITQMLHRWQSGDMDARERLFEALYADLLFIARQRMARQTPGTLQPAALVNESLMRLLGSDVSFKDRAHFVAVAALKMRSVLVDQIRAKNASKRGGELEQVTLSWANDVVSDTKEAASYDVMALHQALNRLAEIEPRAASTVELTYFGGMDREEIALVLSVSVPTVDRDLRFARAWLNRHLA